MPVVNYLKSIHELPDSVKVSQNLNGIWELRLKGILIGQYPSSEMALNDFSEKAKKLEKDTGIDLTPKVIEEAILSTEKEKPKTFINRLLEFLNK